MTDPRDVRSTQFENGEGELLDYLDDGTVVTRALDNDFTHSLEILAEKMERSEEPTARRLPSLEPTAQRLRSLYEGITAPDPDSQAHRGWAGIDVIQVLDPAGAAREIRSTPLRDASLARKERWRNLVALGPLMLTWIGVGFALDGYAHSQQQLHQHSFLYLWQHSFNGHLSPWWEPFNRLLTPGFIALGDLFLLILMFYLTYRTQNELSDRQVLRERQAASLEMILQHVGWHAALRFSQRTSPVAARDEFVTSSRELLRELRAYREHIQTVGESREREYASLKSFSDSFQTSSEHLMRHSRRLGSTYAALLKASGTVDRHLSELVGHAASVNTAVSATNGHNRTLVQQLSEAAALLPDSVDQSVEASGKISTSIEGLKQELSELRTQLESERNSYGSAAAQANTAAQELSRALDRTTDVGKSLKAGADALHQIMPEAEKLVDSWREAVATLPSADRLRPRSPRILRWLRRLIHLLRRRPLRRS